MADQRRIKTEDRIGMKIFSFDQGSMEWNALRAGVVTASEFKHLVTDKLKPRGPDTETPYTYLCTKLAERWRGGPLPGFTAIATEFGKIRETNAVPFFELTYGLPVKRVGFIMSDDGLTGCSPDGLLEDSGLEVKCLQDQNHLKYLLAGILPDEFAAQVHFSMYVTGFKTWHFFSYCSGFPPLLVVVKRDDKIMEMIEDTVTNFLAKFGTYWGCLVKINGGVEPAPNPFRQSILDGTYQPPASEVVEIPSPASTEPEWDVIP